MNHFGANLWGDPCRECGYSWSVDEADAERAIEELPERFVEAALGRTGDERPAGASWNVTAYVFHVADNFRIWAERVVAVAHGAAGVVPYDQDDLAAVRGYERLSLDAGLFALDRSVLDWRAAREVAAGVDVVVVHPEMGLQEMSDIVRQIGHDGAHHLYDVMRAGTSP